MKRVRAGFSADTARMILNRSLMWATLLFGLGCARPQPVAATIGPSGGTLEASGAALSIPAGALSEDVKISITPLTSAPAGYVARSQVYELEPSGLQFAAPVNLALDFTGESAGLAVYLTSSSGTGFERIAGTVEGSRITAPITHFSQAFAGQQEGAGGTIALEEWDEMMLEISCHNLVNCGSFTSLAACKLQQAPTYTFDLANLQKAVSSGRMSYDATAAKGCHAAAMERTLCIPGDQLRLSLAAELPACDAMFAGTVAAAGACYVGEECQTGFCTATTATCPGACKGYKVENEAVPAGERCAYGLYTYDGKCLKPVAGSGSCAPIAPAVARLRCEAGRYCDQTSNTCLAVKSAGATCASSAECATGTSCDTQGTKTCVALGKQGGACQVNKGLACVSELACVQTAVDAAGTCQPKRAVGESCGQQADCTTGNYCTGVSPELGTCQPKKAAGATCAYTSDCQTPLYCATAGPAKGCTAKKAVGESCQGREECLSQVCTSNLCAQASCLAP
jgi:hypothetical protein